MEAAALRIPRAAPPPPTEAEMEAARRADGVQARLVYPALEAPLARGWAAYLDAQLDPRSVLRGALAESRGRGGPSSAAAARMHVSWEEMAARIASVRESLRRAILHGKKALGIRGKLSKRRIAFVRHLVVKAVADDILVTRCLELAPSRGLVRAPRRPLRRGLRAPASAP